MELIIPSAEIWNQGDSIEDMWKHIARCTRVCYQSEKKDDKETEEEFVKRVILRNITDMNTLSCNFEKLHGAMLEHGTVYLFYPWVDDTPVRLPDVVKHYCNNPYSKENYIYGTKCGSYITTNLRVIYENGWLDDLKYIYVPTEHHARRVTVSFTTNIGVTREFNRHRVDSPSEESTRYCNYNKRNDSQLNIGLPAWLLDEGDIAYMEGHKYDEVFDYAKEIYQNEESTLLYDWTAIDFYMCSLTFSQWCYNMLIKKGWKPQQAREVLPLATKSQLIHTAFVDDWKHFFALRAEGVSGPVHPNAKLLAKPLMDKFKELNLI